MPYNDFLELGVEGGLLAICLWIAFIVTLTIHLYQRGSSILPVAGLLIIQLTNFGFQAIPAFVLFLLYSGMVGMRGVAGVGRGDGAVAVDRGDRGLAVGRGLAPGRGAWGRIALPTGIAGLAALLLFHQAVVAKDFYRCSQISRVYTPDAIRVYQELSPSLTGFQYYHQRFGDAWLACNQYAPALSQYLLAASCSVNPAILMKCGYCYRQLRRYDSSEYYYRLLQNMQPYRFAPKMALLNLYQAEGDEGKILIKAREIVDMPVKVNSGQVAEIKAYARKILEKQ